MTIALFPTNMPLLILVSMVLAGVFLFGYPLHQTVVSVSQSPQLPPSLPPHTQSSKKHTLPSNTLFHNTTLTNIATTTSNTINGTTIFDLQSHFLNLVSNKVQNSIVQITSKIPSLPPPSSSALDIPQPNPPSTTNPDEDQNATALGSGFVYDTKGHIITNYHVVSNAKTVDVIYRR
jgi:S1-C subfamily serine protease